MVKCSGVRKAECNSPCSWIIGRGCYNPERSKVVSQQIKEEKVVEKVSKPKATKEMPFVGATLYFSGFKNDSLKEEVQRKGGKVVSSLSPKVTHLVYVLTSRNKEKVTTASTQMKLSLQAFVKKYNLSTVVDVKTKVDKPSTVKQSKPVKVESRWWKTAPHFTIQDWDYKSDKPKFNNAPDSVMEGLATDKSINNVCYKHKSIPDIHKQLNRIIISMSQSKSYDLPKIPRILNALFYVPAQDLLVVVGKITRKDSRREIDLVAFEVKFDPSQTHKFNIGSYFELQKGVQVKQSEDNVWLLNELSSQFEDHVVSLMA